jgi:hypothetical protein
MHAGEEGVATRRAALLGVIGRELRPLAADPVDVRRFADHQALVVDARLHPADVVAHDEQDVGLLLRRLRNGRSGHRHRGQGRRRDQGSLGPHAPEAESSAGRL